MRPLDELTFCHSYAELSALMENGLGTAMNPLPLSEPYLIHVNEPLAQQLGIDIENTPDSQLTRLLSGQAVHSDWKPFAMKYTGHQFGQYNPDLGDGRGLLLTELIDPQGRKWDFHLKGSGQTPYSRGGDGRAVIRSSVREYLISAAMQGLGIPTTQALAIIGSKTQVMREEMEYGATLLRVAPSHIRFGHFEYLFYTGQHDRLSQLADYVIQWHRPHLVSEPEPYARLFADIVHTTAHMIAAWHAYGFCHGVMNTDNMSILGLTFDYGPFAFMDRYQPDYICNHSDYSGRYAFDQQPGIALWNLSALGYALSPILNQEQAEAMLKEYGPLLQQQYRGLMLKRFALTDTKQSHQLINDFLELLRKYQLDLNYTLRTLSETDTSVWDSTQLTGHVPAPDMQNWLEAYKNQLKQAYDTENERQALMKKANPKYILRTHLAQQAIEEVEKGNFGIIEDWLTVLATPFAEHNRFIAWSLPAEPGASAIQLSCSS